MNLMILLASRKDASEVFLPVPHSSKVCKQGGVADGGGGAAPAIFEHERVSCPIAHPHQHMPLFKKCHIPQWFANEALHLPNPPLLFLLI